MCTELTNQQVVLVHYMKILRIFLSNYFFFHSEKTLEDYATMLLCGELNFSRKESLGEFSS